jgi:hypothetical protein
MKQTPTVRVTAHLGELAETLNALRQRFRQAARVEVARAVGEALRDVATDLICGPARVASMSRPEYASWDDPWRDPASDPWYGGPETREEVEPDDKVRTTYSPLEPAVVIALMGARWTFLRTGNFMPAAAIGLLVGLVAYAGGPAAEALLGAWNAASELITMWGKERR